MLLQARSVLLLDKLVVVVVEVAVRLRRPVLLKRRGVLAHAVPRARGVAVAVRGVCEPIARLLRDLQHLQKEEREEEGRDVQLKSKCS